MPAEPLVDQWKVILGGYAPLVWISVVVLGSAWLFLPFWVYVDARRRDTRPVLWISLLFLFPVVGFPVVLLLIPRYFPLFALGILIIPLALIVIYMIMRASVAICADCGRALRPEWRYCPRHPQRVRMPSPQPLAVPAGVEVFTDSSGYVAEASSRMAAPRIAPIDSGMHGAKALLVIQAGRDRGRQIPISAVGVVLGRSPESDVVLDDSGASGRHAQVSMHDRRAQIIDLGSSNGTFVNDASIDRAFLYDGDRIQLGDTLLVFKELT